MKRLKLSSFKLTEVTVCYKSIYDRPIADKSTAANANAWMLFSWLAICMQRALLQDSVKHYIKVK